MSNTLFFHAQTEETKGNIEFLQLYPCVSAGALIEIFTMQSLPVALIRENKCTVNTSKDFFPDKCSVSLKFWSIRPVKSVRRRTYGLSQTDPVTRSFVTGRCIVVLLGTSLSGYALLVLHGEQRTISIWNNVHV